MLSGSGDAHAVPMALLLRALGVVYVAAFVSLGVQIRGLLGQDGILPALSYLNELESAFGRGAWTYAPSIFWWGCSDTLLEGACWVGAAAGLGAALGLAPGPLLLLAWFLYGSLVSVGQVFLNYQWDVLLLEAGFLAPWATRWKLLLSWRSPPEPSFLIVILYRWLLFRLMFASGCVKVRSDTVWRDLSALDYHFWTQPLPPWTAWWMQQLPGGIRASATALTLVLELGGPWLILAGRRGRRAAFLLFSVFQLALIATGNFGFFNLLTLALGLPLLSSFQPEPREDPALEAESREQRASRSEEQSGEWAGRLATGARVGLAGLVFVLSVGSLGRMFRADFLLPSPLDAIEREVAPWRLVNGYGLFADMTEERPELVVELSADGHIWAPVEFKWKPGPTDARPKIAFLHMPRLDWQMWFEALHYGAQASLSHGGGPPEAGRGYRIDRWFGLFLAALLRPEADVQQLLASPVSSASRSWIRVVAYRYRFSTLDERRRSGDWWIREPAGTFVPPLQIETPAATKLDAPKTRE